MWEHDATEEAYKHGYEKGYEAGKKVATDNNVGSKWIPVSEKLPEDEKWVLCLTNTSMYWIAMWNYCNDRLWTDHETWSSKTYITHWMHLPEPPKEV